MSNKAKELNPRQRENLRMYGVAVDQDPLAHGRTPFRIFDPGSGDPWRELHLVDADNKGVTSLGPLQDPTDMTLGNAVFLLECANNYEYLVKRVADLEDERNNLKFENAKLLAEVADLKHRLNEVKSEI